MTSAISFNSQNGGVPKVYLPGLFASLRLIWMAHRTTYPAVLIGGGVLHNWHCWRMAMTVELSLHAMEEEPCQDTRDQIEMLTSQSFFSQAFSSVSFFGMGYKYRRASLIPTGNLKPKRGLDWEIVYIMGLSKMIEMLLLLDPYIVRAARVFQERWHDDENYFLEHSSTTAEHPIHS